MLFFFRRGAPHVLLLALNLFFVDLHVVSARRNGEEEKEVEAIVPNPYAAGGSVKNDDGNSAAVCPTTLDWIVFEPYYIITTPIPTQIDTFEGIEYAKIMDTTLPVYHVHQPDRLNPAQLGFRLILVKELKGGELLSGIRAVDVDPNQARDSWFPGYSWSPLIMSCGAAGEQQQHVGWKFTATTTSAGTTTLPYFYALMVEVGNKKKNVFESIRLGGFPRAAGAWLGKIQ